MTEFSKKIFVCVNDLGVGGIQAAFSQFIKSIPEWIHVDVLVLSGGSIALTGPNIRQINSPRALQAISLSQRAAKEKGPFFYGVRGFLALFSRIFSHSFPYAVCMRFFKSRDYYDVAISYSQNASPKILYGGCPQLVINRIHAKKKILFVHDDFRRPFNRARSNIRAYKRFDTIVALSAGCKENIQKELPNSHIVVIPNMIDLSDLPHAPVKPQVTPFWQGEGKICFITVCRLAEEKGIERALEVFAKFDKPWFKWVIVGGGQLKETLQTKIVVSGLSSDVFLLGEIKNPRPLYYAFDAYLMCSFNEARPVVIDEAHVAGIPVVAMEYASSSDQLFKSDVLCSNNGKALFLTLDSIRAGKIKLFRQNNIQALKEQNARVKKSLEALLLS